MFTCSPAARHSEDAFVHIHKFDINKIFNIYLKLRKLSLTIYPSVCQRSWNHQRREGYGSLLWVVGSFGSGIETWHTVLVPVSELESSNDDMVVLSKPVQSRTWTERRSHPALSVTFTDFLIIGFQIPAQLFLWNYGFIMEARSLCPMVENNTYLH